MIVIQVEVDQEKYVKVHLYTLSCHPLFVVSDNTFIYFNNSLITRRCRGIYLYQSTIRPVILK